MLKQLRRSELAGVSLWQEHWRQFDQIRFDAEAIRWDGFLDVVDARVHQGPILEAGCGLGKYLLYMRTRGAHVAGVDFAREPLQAIRRRVGPAPVAVADLVRLPFPSETFSTIFCLGVIEHFEGGATQVMGELVRTLRPGGLLIVTVPYANAFKRWRAVRGGSNVVRAADAAPPGWTFYQFCYGASELRQIVENAGLAIVAERRIGKMFSLAGWLERWRGRGRNSSRPGQLEDRRLPHAENGSRGPHAMKCILKKSVLWTEPLLPAPLMAHMALAVGRKPPNPPPTTDRDAFEL